MPFFPDHSAPGNPGKGPSGGAPLSIGSPVLAGPSPVCGHCVSPGRLSLGDSNQKGPFVPGSGDNLSPRQRFGNSGLRPICRPGVQSWDLSLVLEGLSNAPFECLESASVKLLTLKLPFLIAITSLKRIGDLQALSVTSSCLDIASGLVKVILHPRLYNIPKVPFLQFHCVVLQPFSPPPFETQEKERRNKLCLVRIVA